MKRLARQGFCWPKSHIQTPKWDRDRRVAETLGGKGGVGLLPSLGGNPARCPESGGCGYT